MAHGAAVEASIPLPHLNPDSAVESKEQTFRNEANGFYL
jgi:hypothetical protein